MQTNMHKPDNLRKQMQTSWSMQLFQTKMCKPAEAGELVIELVSEWVSE